MICPLGVTLENPTKTPSFKPNPMNDSSELYDEKVASLLKGNTLRVYWVFFRSEDGVVGVREIQRDLKFSSPTFASATV